MDILEDVGMMRVGGRTGTELKAMTERKGKDIIVGKVISIKVMLSMVIHAYNPNYLEGSYRRSASSRPAWAI
jgi:hypothetical protein